jgi:hypothetical protein
MTDEPKNKGGRPWLYRPEYCESVKEFLADGTHSIHAWAAKNGFTRRVVAKWAHDFPEFGEALDIAKGLKSHAIEEMLTTNEYGNAKTNFFVLALKNCSPDDWVEKKQVELSGTIETTRTLKDMSDDELAAIASGSGGRVIEASQG